MAFLTRALLLLIWSNTFASGLICNHPRWRTITSRSSSKNAPCRAHGTSFDYLERLSSTRSVDVHDETSAEETDMKQYRTTMEYLQGLSSSQSAVIDHATSTAAKQDEQFIIDLDKAGLSACHGILHAYGCRCLSDLRDLTLAQIASMSLDDSHKSNIVGIQTTFLELSQMLEGLSFATNKSPTFEVVCAKNEIYKGRLFSPDQCNQLKRMSEHHAYQNQIDCSWHGMPCKNIPGYIDTIENNFWQLFAELYLQYPGLRNIEFESDQEPHLVKYSVNGVTNGGHLHKDTEHKSITVNLLLSNENDFGGGGTYIKAIDKVIKLKQGEFLVHPGNLEHAGADITFGVRHLLVAFLDCEWDETKIDNMSINGL